MNEVDLIDTATIDNTKFGKALFDRMDLLKQYFTKTYGAPQYDKCYPKQEKMNNGKAFYAYMWKVGKKEISVGIALEETDRGIFILDYTYSDTASHMPGQGIGLTCNCYG